MAENGRGIALWIKPTLKPAAIEVNTIFQENIFVECKLEDGETLKIGLIYRSPSSTNENSSKLNSIISEMCKNKNDNIIIMGDFNYKDIDWETESCSVSSDHPASKFLQSCKDNFLVQMQRSPTRFKNYQTPSLLDLVLTNKEELITNIDTEAGLGKSDHVTLVISLSCKAKNTKYEPRLNYRKADLKALNEDLAKVDWEVELKDLNTESMWSKIKNNIETAIEKHVPKTKPHGSKFKKWMSNETLDIVKNKHRLHHIDKQSIEYKKANNKARKACRKARRNLEENVASQSVFNNKIFWSYTNSKIKSRSGIADLKKPDGTKTANDTEKAETLNSFFKSVFNVENDGDLPDPPSYEYDNTLEDFEITVSQVKKLLLNLKPGKAPGPDGITPLLLSSAAESLALPVTMLFRQSLYEGSLPNEWKLAKVTPIFKKGSKQMANNYRPVSLTCVLCKVLEKIVREKLIEHLEANNLICENQHGFVTGKSCSTQLLETLENWTKILDERGSVDAIYMDFMKAFDCVPHRRLMLKLEALGVKGPVFNWIGNFLANRRQFVVVNNSCSQEANVTSGIPQGSVLGPILFVVYINDLPRVCSSSVKLFADDTKVFTRSDVEGATETLQEDLDKLQVWANTWLMKFHPEKCHVLKLGSKKSETTYSMSSRDTNGIEKRVMLEESNHEKDLGVYVDNKLSFREHIHQITMKANRLVGIIRRTFDYLTEEMFVKLYKGIVRPIIEYGHSVYQPELKSLCQEIENVQRRATKILSTLRDKTYPERLRILGLPSLEHRRRRGDMIDLYKYIHGHYTANEPSFIVQENDRLRGHPLKLGKEQHRLRIRGNSFAVRVINSWNSLPEEVVTANTVNTFKTRLDKHWHGLPSIYDPECYH